MSLSCEEAEYGDTKVLEFVERNKNLCADDLINNKACYHKKCYSEFTNIEKRNRAIQRYTDALEQGQVTIAKREAGRPSSNTFEIENEVRQLRSQSIQYNKDICIICQSPSGTAHRVETLETRKLMFSVANEISNKDFFLELNSIPNPEDGVANDVRYHLPCWVKAKKEAQRIERFVTTDKEDDIGQILSDIEILNLIECELNDPSKNVLDMNTVNTVYKELLQEKGTEENDIKDNYKIYLNKLIQSNIFNAKFIKNKNPSKPEHICSTDTNVEAFDRAMKKPENINDILHVVKIIRKELTEHTRWKFKGTFQTFTLPPLVNKLVQWILIGPRENIQKMSRRDSAENVTPIVTQMIYQSFKTRRQVNYEPKTNTSRVMTSNIETPLNVGLGLYLHQKTRSKISVIFCQT